MKMSPEMIDAATMQLKMLFEHGEGIPENVAQKGKDFVTALDEWSDELKKEALSAAT